MTPAARKEKNQVNPQPGEIWSHYGKGSEIRRYFLFLKRIEPASPTGWRDAGRSERWLVIQLDTGLTRPLEFGIYRADFTKEE